MIETVGNQTIRESLACAPRWYEWAEETMTKSKSTQTEATNHLNEDGFGRNDDSDRISAGPEGLTRQDEIKPTTRQAKSTTRLTVEQASQCGGQLVVGATREEVDELRYRIARMEGWLQQGVWRQQLNDR